MFLDILGCESVIPDVSEALAYSPLGSVGTWTTSTTVKKQSQTHDIKTSKSGRMKKNPTGLMIQNILSPATHDWRKRWSDMMYET